MIHLLILGLCLVAAETPPKGLSCPNGIHTDLVVSDSLLMHCMISSSGRSPDATPCLDIVAGAALVKFATKADCHQTWKGICTPDLRSPGGCLGLLICQICSLVDRPKAFEDYMLCNAQGLLESGDPVLNELGWVHLSAYARPRTSGDRCDRLIITGIGETGRIYSDNADGNQLYDRAIAYYTDIMMGDGVTNPKEWYPVPWPFRGEPFKSADESVVLDGRLAPAVHVPEGIIAESDEWSEEIPVPELDPYLNCPESSQEELVVSDLLIRECSKRPKSTSPDDLLPCLFHNYETGSIIASVVSRKACRSMWAQICDEFTPRWKDRCAYFLRCQVCQLTHYPDVFDQYMSCNYSGLIHHSKKPIHEELGWLIHDVVHRAVSGEWLRDGKKLMPTNDGCAALAVVPINAHRVRPDEFLKFELFEGKGGGPAELLFVVRHKPKPPIPEKDRDAPLILAVDWLHTTVVEFLRCTGSVAFTSVAMGLGTIGLALGMRSFCRCWTPINNSQPRPHKTD